MPCTVSKKFRTNATAMENEIVFKVTILKSVWVHRCMKNRGKALYRQSKTSKVYASDKSRKSTSIFYKLKSHVRREIAHTIGYLL